MTTKTTTSTSTDYAAIMKATVEAFGDEGKRPASTEKRTDQSPASLPDAKAAILALAHIG
jgi:hypothetical protein